MGSIMMGRFRTSIVWLLPISTLFFAGCATSPQTHTNDREADISHSGKAIVITDTVRDDRNILGQHLSPGDTFYTNVNAIAPGKDKISDSSFRVIATPYTYLIDPGDYFLSRIGDYRSSLEFDQAHSPVHFKVSAGDVLYLGQLHYQAGQPNPDNSGCGAGIRFSVQDAWGEQRADLEDRLDGTYPGAKEKVRKALFSVDSQMVGVKPKVGC